jgi:hypothetical protein
MIYILNINHGVHTMFNDWSSTKSYANEENLNKALTKLGLDKFNSLHVRTPEGRWTAIFGKNFMGEDFMMACWNGFKVLG